MIADLLPTEDQSMIEETVASFLADHLPPTRLRDEAAGGGVAEQAVWLGLAEIGLFGLGLSEAAGGVGYGLPEEIIAARELGRSLASTNVLATMLAAHLLTDDTAALEALKAGSAHAAFANRIEGDAAAVQLIDAAGAEHLVVWDEAGARLLPAASASERAARGAMDATIALERARLDQGAGRSAGPALALRADLYASAYLAGIAEATTAMAVEYAKTRRQFDQPIGAFQAIKHACADMAVRAEAARAQTFYAALSLEAGEPEAPAEVAAARLIARRAALENAKANIQIHGAMGFTQETEAHLFLKRAHLVAALNGSLAGDLARLRP
jgi:alkylation response protein AidB-like acyl-CoA dehydrogenase